MGVVRGPMRITASRAYTCTGCGRDVEAGSELLLGRCNGRSIHACCEACFDDAVAKVELEYPVVAHVGTGGGSRGEG